jgi:nucleoside-diphosphate-sugar epimerase
MRALIIGGLGYIGSELIEQYKLVDNSDIEVDILDKRFIPHIVADLPGNFHFWHGDMKDERIIELLLQRQPDIVFLLAAEVQAESSVHREGDIWKNNFEALIKIIEKCPSGSKLIFASTGNVFGGVDESEKYMDLTEEDKPRPKYPYAESKRAVEQYLLGSDKKFVICRFGTNYGYAPGIRFNLVTNNFVKKVLAREAITIHGKGENFRPTVCVKDAVSAMLFLCQREEANGEIFHVVCDNFKIKELAKKISSIDPAARIEYIAKEVPFSSYNLSSEKIRNLGFEFKWDLKKAMEDMANRFTSLKK